VSAPVLVFLVTGLLALAVLVVLAVGLVQNALRLARTVKRFSEDIRPALDEITAGAERASERTARLQERASAARR